MVGREVSEQRSRQHVPTSLLEHRSGLDRTQSEPAVLRRNEQLEPAELVELPPDVAREGALLQTAETLEAPGGGEEFPRSVCDLALDAVALEPHQALGSSNIRCAMIPRWISELPP